MEELKAQAIEKIQNCEGGFFLLTYDEDGFCEMLEAIGDNKAAFKASKLSDYLSAARIEYANWRTKQDKK